jgi:TRAP-type C4-dicarboxylate transport system permease small subunit
MRDHPPSFLAIVARLSGRVLRVADRLAEGLVILLFAGILLVGGLQVISRYVFNSSLSWSEEFQRYGLIWIVFLALVIGYRRGAHIGMEFLSRKLPAPVQTGIGWMCDLLWLGLGLAMVGFTTFYRFGAGLTFLGSVGRQRSAGMDVPMNWIYMCIVIGGAYLIAAAVHNLLQRAAGVNPSPPAKEADPC